MIQLATATVNVMKETHYGWNQLRHKRHPSYVDCDFEPADVSRGFTEARLHCSAYSNIPRCNIDSCMSVAATKSLKLTENQSADSLEPVPAPPPPSPLPPPSLSLSLLSLPLSLSLSLN